MKKNLFLYFIFMVILATGFGCNKEPRVSIRSASLRVELAQTSEELQRGLQYRDSLPKDQGMLFIFPQNVEAMFWMKNTLFPIDILWIDENRKIIHIEKNVPPCFEQICPTYGPKESVLYVLEANPGFADAHGIAVGDEAVFSFVDKR